VEVAAMTRRAALLALLFALACGPLKRFGYEGIGRDRWQQPERVVAALGIVPGTKVADLGAGGGYFTGHLADAVGPTGLVYAIDVDPEMTAYLEDHARPNVNVILAHEEDPQLAERVDLIFTCNTYHHIQNRSAYFANAQRHLRPGGRVAIVEYKKHGWLQRIFPHYTPPETIRAEMTAAGYRVAAEHDFLERQSFLVFEAETEIR
jgi:predicted methyltransferase